MVSVSLKKKFRAGARHGRMRPELRLAELGVFLDQFLQAESMKLYRNLGVIPIALAMIDDSFAVFRMADAVSLEQSRGPRQSRGWIAGVESAACGGRLRRGLGAGELLTARGKEVGDVVDGVVGRAGVGAAAAELAVAAASGRARKLQWGRRPLSAWAFGRERQHLPAGT